MTNALMLSNSLLLVQLGWVLLHFLWQGLLVLALLSMTLRLLRQATPQVRFRVACLALAVLAILPPLTFLLISQQATSKTLSAFVSALGAGWLGGTAVLAFYAVVQVLRLELYRAVGTKPLPCDRERDFREMARRLGVHRPVVFLESLLVKTPATIGWLRPVVLIPPIAHVLSQGKLDAVMAHELAHIKRRDFLGALVQNILEVAFFFHPAVSCITDAIKIERECCCDQLAAEYCEDRYLYASALCELATAGRITTTLAVSADDGSLKSRIIRLLGIDTPGWVTLRTWSTLLSTAGLGMVLLFGVGYAYRVQAQASGGPAVQPVVAVDLAPENVTYESPVDIQIPTGGRYAFRTTLSTGDRRNTFTVYLETPASVLMQLVPLEEGFEPLLTAAWMCRHGPDHMDGDVGSGRGNRPFLRIVCGHGAPDNWVRFEVPAFHPIETPKMPDATAEYIGVIWQPRVHNDIDPNVIGPESTPVLLDAHGRGDPHLRKGQSPPPTLDYPHDIDTFQVRSRSTEAMTITIDGRASGMSPFLRVYDQNGQLRTAAPNRREGVVQLTVQPEVAGERFYFAVTAYDGTGMGGYAVRVTESSGRDALVSLE